MKLFQNWNVDSGCRQEYMRHGQLTPIPVATTVVDPSFHESDAARTAVVVFVSGSKSGRESIPLGGLYSL